MRFAKSIVVAAMVMALNLPGLAQEARPGISYKPKSEKAALNWSSFGFLAPVGAGAAVWAAQKGKTHNYIGKRWVGPGLYDFVEEPFTYTESPDRTLPIALIAAGVVIGPSLGYFYGGCPEKGFISIGKRVGILGATYLVGYTTFSGPFEENSITAAILISGGVLTIASAVHDISASRDAVREHNASLGKITIAPTYFATNNAPGVAITMKF